MIRNQTIYLWLSSIPFLTVLYLGYVWGWYHRKNVIVLLANRLQEVDMEELLINNGWKGSSFVALIGFRMVFATVCCIPLFGELASKEPMAFVKVAIFWFICFKIWYLYLRLQDRNRLSRLNQLLPYMIKTISYLCYMYPLTHALKKSIAYAPKEFRNDIEQLVQEIDDEPLSYVPYQRWVHRYHGKLRNFDYEMKLLYRLGQSSGKDYGKLLNSLNLFVADETQRIRKQKNETVNSLISWLGMLPVLYLGFMLAFMMFMGVMSQL